MGASSQQKKQIPKPIKQPLRSVKDFIFSLVLFMTSRNGYNWCFLASNCTFMSATLSFLWNPVNVCVALDVLPYYPYHSELFSLSFFEVLKNTFIGLLLEI
jgi:hypothetical protein